MGKHSGRAALRAKLKELGFDLADNQLNDVFVRFKALADRKKEVYDDDLMALMRDQASDDGPRPHPGEVPARHLRHRGAAVGRPDPVDRRDRAPGDGHGRRSGRCDLQLRSRRSSRTRRKLQLYQVHAVTEGTDAQATVTVRLEEDGRIVTGTVGRYRHGRGLGQGLCQRAEPADRPAAEIGPGCGCEDGELPGRGRMTAQ